MVLESGAAGAAAGWLFAWAVRKARGAVGAADRVVDRLLEQALERLEAVVGQRLSGDSAAARLEEEAQAAAAGGEPVDGEVGSGLSERTRQRVALAIEDAAEDDAAFGVALAECLRQIDAAHAQGAAVGVVGYGSGNTAGRDVRITASGERSVVNVGDDAGGISTGDALPPSSREGGGAPSCPPLPGPSRS